MTSGEFQEFNKTQLNCRGSGINKLESKLQWYYRSISSTQLTMRHSSFGTVIGKDTLLPCTLPFNLIRWYIKRLQILLF